MIESIHTMSPSDAILEKLGVDFELQRVLQAADLEREREDIVLVVDFSRHSLHSDDRRLSGSLDRPLPCRYLGFYLFTRASERESYVQREERQMKTYEAVVIFASDESQHQAGREFLKKEFEGSGITIKKEEDMGDRLLAYPVRKNDRGRYVLYVIESPPEPLKALNKALKLRPEILKYLFVRQDN